ncbi:hypothetical protein D9M70_648830 [compost metagenome]
MEIAITEKGLELLADLNPKVEQNECLLAQKLSAEELEQLNYLLEKLRTTNDQKQ